MIEGDGFISALELCRHATDDYHDMLSLNQLSDSSNSCQMRK